MTIFAVFVRFSLLLWNKQMRYHLLISSLSLSSFSCAILTWLLQSKYSILNPFWKASSFPTQVIHVIFAFLLESFPIPSCVPMSFLWIHNMISVYNCVMSSKHRVWTSTLWESVGDIGKPAGSPHMKWHVEAGHHHEVDLALFTTHRPWTPQSTAWKLCVCACVCVCPSLFHREDEIRARFFFLFGFIYVFLVLSKECSQFGAAGSDYPSRLSTPSMASPPTSPTHSDSSWYKRHHVLLQCPSKVKLTKRCPQ